MGKVFTQIVPNYQGQLEAIEIDINTEANYQLLDKYDIMSIPVSVLIDKDGNTVEKFSGVVSSEVMTQKLKALVN